MNSNKELSWNELNHSYQPSDFSFRTTNEVKVINELLGQEDAIEAIRRGLRINSKGYNLYICDANSRAIDQIIKREVLKKAATQATPMAVGYVYNFQCPEEPLLIQCKLEDAISLKEDLEQLQAFIQNDIPILLETEEVEKKQEEIFEAFELLKEKCFLQIEEKAAAYHLSLQEHKESIQFTFLDEKDEIIGKKDFLLLPLEKQNELMEKVIKVQEYADDLMEMLEKQEATYIERYNEVAQEMVLKEIGGIMKQLMTRYDDYIEIKAYFNDMVEDILNHLELIARTQSEQTEAQKNLAILFPKESIEKVIKNYGFNLMVTPHDKGAPVVDDYDDPQMSLNGKFLLDTEDNMVSSDYRHIRPGLFHYANGGYLILHMEDLLEKPNGWSMLKRMLRFENIRIDGNEELGLVLAQAIKPQPIHADIKVILVGSSAVYEVLSNYDETFKSLFKVKVAFKDEVSCDKTEIEKLAGIIKDVCQKEELLPVSISGLLKLVEVTSRQTDHPKRIPADTEAIIDIIREAQWHAQNQIEAEHIEACLIERNKYENYLQERLDESIKEATYLLDTKGSRVGQVNGLAVYSIGDLTFGRPIRITATTYRGKQGIVDIDNEAKLSGAIHTKGVHIISGFLGHQFAQDFPLSLSCNICFEQSYVPIDGDSASSTELYAILSSLSEQPIMQNLAVTGSVNQFGEIQPIGGVNEKIEGFYKVCQQKGLFGNEGVIIPKQNTKDLALTPEIIEAVKKQKFHIYAIGNIWEGVEIIMNQKKEQVIFKVKEKLQKYSQ